MRTITLKTNRKVCALPLILSFLTSLIGCTALLVEKPIPIPIIDSVPPGTPKGFVEFYAFSAHHDLRQSRRYEKQ